MKALNENMLRVACCATTLLFAGCDGAGDARSRDRVATNNQPKDKNLVVTILGCSDRTRLVREIASEHNVKPTRSGDVLSVCVANGENTIQFSTAVSDNAIEHGRLAAETDVALLVVDMAEGPIPIYREHALLLRSTDVPHIKLVFANYVWNPDAELRDLIELEIRELLDHYDVPDHDAIALYGPPPTPSGAPNAALGLKVVEAVAGLEPRRRRRPEGFESAEARASVYVLAPQEQFAPQPLSALTSGKFDVLLGTETVSVDVEVAEEVASGTNGTVALDLPHPMRLGKGERLVLFRDDRIVATGFVIE